MSSLVVNVKEGKNGWVGTVTLPGLNQAKLARQDGQTVFPTKVALTTVARNLAKRLGQELEYAEPAKKAAKKTPTNKPAAKRSAKKDVSQTCDTTDCKAPPAANG